KCCAQTRPTCLTPTVGGSDDGVENDRECAEGWAHRVSDMDGGWGSAGDLADAVGPYPEKRTVPRRDRHVDSAGWKRYVERSRPRWSADALAPHPRVTGGRHEQG